ncbi:protein containing Peptidase M17, leucyl aminopeptidase, partial [mine drainage metagenome]
RSREGIELQAKAADAELKKLRVDVIVLPYFQGEPLGPAAVAVDRALDGLFTRMLDSKEASGKFPERVLLPTMGRLAAPRVVYLCLGQRTQLDGYRLRNALEFAARQLRPFCHSAAVAVDPALREVMAAPATGQAPQSLARAIVEGVALGNYRVGELKSAEAQGQL